ncbi:restriction endonuclease subunit S [Winogradskyella psychrotolerans]|uniref:restriction endonuclease subunit S n=1 Tax=Winogradskyella psychrotolerans TaxID=1344585 RepID=UPI001C075A1A|nr:restriction endonuclease subunit S [Winogradskyella psychrotolerans]MBU2929437.1 restriction endonuclease subunit S [Winogradskyella psychrotolerans]
MSNWRRKTIKELVDLNIIYPPMDGNHGETHPKGNDFIESGIPFVMASDIENGKINYSKCKYISKEQAEKLRKGFSIEGDVLLTHKATIGRTALVSKLSIDYIMLTPQVTYYRVKDEKVLSNEFLKYYFDNSTFQELIKLMSGSGSTRAYIGITAQKNLYIKYPSLFRQKQIAKVLSDLDAKIEVNNKINQELEAMAKTLYDYWFVQFDFPDANGKPYKSSGGEMVFNEVLKREIPEGWEVDDFLSVANITTGRLDSNAEVKNGEYYFYTCAANPTKTDSYSFDDSVILIAGNNAAGNFHVNRFTGKFNAYQRTYVVTANELKYLDYLYQVVFRQMKVLKTRGNGSQTKFLTIGMLNNIHVFETNSNLMEEFSEKTIPMYKKQVNLMNENQKLSELRDWLLPMLMNGQVRVAHSQADGNLGEVAQELGMVAEERANYK